MGKVLSRKKIVKGRGEKSSQSSKRGSRGLEIKKQVQTDFQEKSVCQDRTCWKGLRAASPRCWRNHLRKWGKVESAAADTYRIPSWREEIGSEGPNCSSLLIGVVRCQCSARPLFKYVHECPFTDKSSPRRGRLKRIGEEDVVSRMIWGGNSSREQL